MKKYLLLLLVASIFFVSYKTYATWLIPQRLMVSIEEKVDELNKDAPEMLEEILDDLVLAHARSDISMYTRFSLRQLIEYIRHNMPGSSVKLEAVADLAVASAEIEYDEENENFEIEIIIFNKSKNAINIAPNIDVVSHCSLHDTQDYVFWVDSSSILSILAEDVGGWDEIKSHPLNLSLGESATIKMETSTHTMINVLTNTHNYSQEDAEEYVDQLREKWIDCEVDVNNDIPDSDRKNNSITIEIQGEEEQSDGHPDWIIENIDGPDAIEPGEDLNLTFDIKNIWESTFDLDVLFGESYENYNSLPIALTCGYDVREHELEWDDWSIDVWHLLFPTSETEDQDKGNFINLAPWEDMTIQATYHSTYDIQGTETEVEWMRESWTKFLRCEIAIRNNEYVTLENSENNAETFVFYVTN